MTGSQSLSAGNDHETCLSSKGGIMEEQKTQRFAKESVRSSTRVANTGMADAPPPGV